MQTNATRPVPATLNGYRVVKFDRHANCCTIMVERSGYLPFVVATWWEELGDSWSWGHYCDDRAEADREFATVAHRNVNR